VCPHIKRVRRCTLYILVHVLIWTNVVKPIRESPLGAHTESPFTPFPKSNKYSYNP
jgi:hypothetical protein